MDFDDITKKATDFLNDDKVKEALNSEQAEEASDSLLDGVATAADKVTGGKYSDQIAGARDAADKSVGNE